MKSSHRGGLRHRIGELGAIVALGIFISGCGGSDSEVKTTGTVSGSVQYGGEPVTEGSVHFYSKEKGIGATAVLDSSGQFQMTSPIEVGSYTVSVTPPPPPEPGTGGVETPEVKEYPNIPERYRSEQTSDLHAEVKEGENTIPLEMTAS